MEQIIENNCEFGVPNYDIQRVLWDFLYIGE